jgi:hypothetical protein
MNVARNPDHIGEIARLPRDLIKLAQFLFGRDLW